MDQGKIIRFSLVGLPAGLFILGVASLLYTQLRPPDPTRDKNYQKFLEAASLNRSEINQADLERSLSILTVEIGERHAAFPEAIERTAVWIESSFRGGALGYRFKREIFPVSPEVGEWKNLVAELPGKSRQREVITIATRYDSPLTESGHPGSDRGVALLLALARSFAGDPLDRTIRFVFLAGAEGSEVYARNQASAGEGIVAVLFLDSGTVVSTENPGIAFPAFASEENTRPWLTMARNAFQSATGLTPPEGTWPTANQKSGCQAFADAGYATVLVSGSAAPPTTINLENLERTGQGLRAIIQVWANP